MVNLTSNSTYDVTLSYDENYSNGPTYTGSFPEQIQLNASLIPASFLGRKVNSTFGVPAGPLLNSAYIKLYADLGFDILTYKTVRTVERACHPYPNVRAVQTWPNWYAQTDTKPSLQTLPNYPTDNLSITNSFGMPSRRPQEWQADVALSRASLHTGQILVVSVVGTGGSSLEELASDFANAAVLAAEAGADAIEANLSCPNVQSREGSLYQNPASVEIVADTINGRLAGRVPFLLKIGFLTDTDKIRAIVEAASKGGASGISAINTIPAQVFDQSGNQALPGEGRLISGICGAGIKTVGLAMSKSLLQARKDLGLTAQNFAIVGVGGVMTADDVHEYLRLGVDGVQSGTGAMWNPTLAQEFKRLV